MIRKYRVVGRYHKVFGFSYGDTFERDLSERQERSLVEAGHVAIVPRDRPKRAVVAVKAKPEPTPSVSLVRKSSKAVVEPSAVSGRVAPEEAGEVATAQVAPDPFL